VRLGNAILNELMFVIRACALLLVLVWTAQVHGRGTLADIGDLINDASDAYDKVDGL
jgi:hypothetical protein